MEIISADAGTQFTSTEFQDEFQTRGFRIDLASPEHQEMSGQVKVAWRMLRTIAHSLMVHAQVSESYINFAFMYTEDHILPVLPIKYLINKDGKLTTPFKLVTGTKPSIFYLRVLFCPCSVRKATAHVGKKSLNIRCQAKNGFLGIFVGITQYQKGYPVYVPNKQKIVYSHDVVFDDGFYSALAYMSQPYAKTMAIRPDVSYIPDATSSKEQTGSIITFAQFEVGNLLSETCNDM